VKKIASPKSRSEKICESATIFLHPVIYVPRFLFAKSSAKKNANLLKIA